MKAIKEVLILVLSSIIVAFIIEFLGENYNKYFFGSPRRDLAFGIKIHYAALTYIFTCSFVSIILSYTKTIKKVSFICIVSYIIFLALFIDGFNSNPLRNTLILISTFGGLSTMLFVKSRFLRKLDQTI